MKSVLRLGPVAAAVLVLTAVSPVFAAEGASWRPTYDLVMRWVNFVILAVLLYKFLKAPLRKFLKAQKDDIAADIEALESRKTAVETRLEETLKAQKDSRARFEQIRARIMAQAQKRKEQIIAEAQNESDIMLSAAKAKIEGRLLQAQHSLRSEMVDRAIALATQRLPGAMTGQDRQNWVDQFVNDSLDR